MNFYEITNTSPEYLTLGDFLTDGQSPGFPKGDSLEKGADGQIDFNKYAQKFVQFQLNSLSNGDRIKNAFEGDLKSQNKIVNAINNPLSWPIIPGIKFVIPHEFLDRATLLTQGVEVVSNNIPAFKAKALAELEADINYVSIKKSLDGAKFKSTIIDKIPNITVWIWCRSLSTRNKDSMMKGQIFDITPFVSTLNTNMGKNGGNFNITLSPVICSSDEDGRWNISKDKIKQAVNPLTKSIEYIADSFLTQPVNDNGLIETLRSQFLFHHMINSNDLIFIRFETLKTEFNQRVSDAKLPFIDKQNIPGRIYDMIGLVDVNNQLTSAEANDGEVTITGRDLSKLFIEDGTYFYAFEQKGGLNFNLGGATAKTDLAKRIESGQLLYLGLYFNTSVERIIQFIIQQLSTIKIVPDDLFDAYFNSEDNIDRRNKRYVETEPAKTSDFDVKINGIFNKGVEKTKLIRKNEKISDPNMVTENNISSKAFNTLLNFVQYIRNKENRDINGNQIAIITGNKTTGWNEFIYNNERIAKNMLPKDLINLYPIINSDKIKKVESTQFAIPSVSLVGEQYAYLPNNVLVKTSTEILDLSTVKELIGICDEYFLFSQQKTKFTNSPSKKENVSGIWQIIKLVIDSNVAQRRLVDSSISSANGSLLNFIRKCCQEPFVEFYMDTYGDQYFLIIRKPPYDRIGLNSMLQGSYKTEDGTVNGVTVIDIEDHNVITERLRMDDSQAYSWYHFTPQNSFFGGTEQYSLSYIPALFFEEYAEIWGSKPMNIVNNYTPYLPLDLNKKSAPYIEKQAYEDLRYMIEISQYLPFARKGSILINQDRRIKVGNIIRYKPTGEIFFVDQVQHNTSISDVNIDAYTNITVSRGLVERFINGVIIKDPQTGNEKRFSYFDIINTDLDFSQQREIVVDEEVEVNYQEKVFFKGYTAENIEEFEINSPSLFTLDGDKNFIKGYELNPQGKVALTAYTDSAGLATIGWGCRFYFDQPGKPIVTLNDPVITLSRAQSIFDAAIKEKEILVKKTFRGKLTKMQRNQFGALVSFAFNFGSIPFSLRDAVVNYIKSQDSGNDQKIAIATKNLEKVWTSYCGYNDDKTKKFIKLNGLVNRRQAELNRFLNQKSQYVRDAGSRTTTQKKKQKVLDQSQLLKDFKVDQEIFNFFLRKEQFDFIVK